MVVVVDGRIVGYILRDATKPRWVKAWALPECLCQGKQVQSVRP